MASRNNRRGFLSRIWGALTATSVPSIEPQRPKATPREAPQQSYSRAPMREYAPTSSAQNEQLANKLIRQYERIGNPKYRGRVDHNTVRKNVEKMSPEVRRYAIAMSDDTLQYEAMMGNITDDDGNNLFWYH